jgi:Lon protease-like protein
MEPRKIDPLKLAEACASLPLFPLPGMALMPGSLLPLHVFEPRYRQLVEDCLAGERPFCVPQVRGDDSRDGHGRPAILPYAAVGRIAAHQQLEDGRYNILVQPLARIRILEEPLSDAPYRVARAAVLQDLPADPETLTRAGEELRTLLAPLLARLGPPAAGMARALQALPAERLADAVAAVALRSEEARQGFLAQDDPLVRARLIREAVLTWLAEAQSDREVAEA